MARAAIGGIKMETQALTEKVVTRWNAPSGRPLTGALFDRSKYDDEQEPPSDCMCAQGWVLFESGMTIEEIDRIDQAKADIEVAERLGISRAHSVLLRQINDTRPDTPSVVLTNPERILGDQARIVLAFWRYIDKMTKEQWYAARDAARDAGYAARGAEWDAAWDAAGDAAALAAGVAARGAAWGAAWDAAWAAARVAAGYAAGSAAGSAAGYAARDAAMDAAGYAAWASNEIQGAAIMRANNKPFFFLRIFGFNDPSEIPS